MATSNITYNSFYNNVILSESDFGIFNDESVKKFTWKTESGFSLTAISYGAVIQAIKVPDKTGKIKDIALGFEDLEGYVKMNTPDLTGCVVGRCVNRIAGARFQLDGVEYVLTNNLGEHHLHGGFAGFDKVNWKSTVDGSKVVFSYLSKDGEQGYPGDLMTNISYEVRNNDTFHIEYTAVTNKKTVVNLTNHSYFNLAGHEAGAEELYNHVVTINADKVLEGDSDWVPTGGLIKVGGTPFDFRSPTRLGDGRINNMDSLRYHHNFVVCTPVNGTKDLTFISRVEHPPSGRYMEIYSDQPSVTFYTGNFIQAQGHPDMVGKGGVIYGRCGGLCLETMNLVDAIHHHHFPSPVLKPGDVYRHRVLYCFGVNE